MVRYSRGWQIFKMRSVPSTLRREIAFCADKFATELLDLWESREMKGWVYVAYEYTIPTGFLLVEYNTCNLQTIRGLWVKQSFRGQGLGRFLMEALFEETDKAGVETKVNITEGAEKFYQKFGFEIGERREDFPDQIRATRKVSLLK